MAGNVGALSLVLRLGEKSITIGGADTPYRLLSAGLDGVAGAEAALTTAENAQLDGAYLLSCRVPGREITLEFEIADYVRREALRAELISFFAPRSQGTLTVVRGRVSRTIGCMLYGCVSMTQETVYDYIRVRVPLYCPDPYFYADAEPRILSRTGEAGLTFPLTLTEDVGVTAGVVTVSDTMALSNTGDAETGFLLVLTALETVDGEGAKIMNPCVTRLSDGAYIRIFGEMAAGDTVTICTLPGAKYILWNGEKTMRFDGGSTFFSLEPGVTTLKLSSDEKTGHLEAVLSWRTKHFGV